MQIPEVLGVLIVFKPPKICALHYKLKVQLARRGLRVLCYVVGISWFKELLDFEMGFPCRVKSPTNRIENDGVSA